MNDLETVTCKIASAREILNSAIDRLQEQQYDRAETLLYAVDEFLQYYLEEFDAKFTDAWSETVSQLKQEEYDAYFSCDRDDTSSGCKSAWNDFWGEKQQYTEEELNAMCDKAELDDKLEETRKANATSKVSKDSAEKM